MISPSFFDEPLDRSGTNCIKWDVAERTKAGMVPMWVADMDFRSPACVQEALEKRAMHATYGYTEITDADSQAVIDFWQRRHQVTLTKEDILLLPGVITGMRVCILTLTQPGEGVIVQGPVYGPFWESIEKTGRKIMDAPLKRSEDGRYTMDLDAVEEQLKNGATMMMLCNPHNPVGRAWEEDELRALKSLLDHYQAALVSDEIHADFVYAPKKHFSSLRLNDDRVVVITAASKTFNLAGLQQATLFVKDPEIREKMRAEMEMHGTIAGNLFALTATRAALNDGDEWLDALKAYLQENIADATKFLRTEIPEAVFSPMEATYLGWLDMRRLGGSTESWNLRCQEAGVMFTPGTFFGPEGEGFLRLNLACPKAQMQEGLRRLAKAVKENKDA